MTITATCSGQKSASKSSVCGEKIILSKSPFKVLSPIEQVTAEVFGQVEGLFSCEV